MNERLTVEVFLLNSPSMHIYLSSQLTLTGHGKIRTNGNNCRNTLSYPKIRTSGNNCRAALLCSLLQKCLSVVLLADAVAKE